MRRAGGGSQADRCGSTGFAAIDVRESEHPARWLAVKWLFRGNGKRIQRRPTCQRLCYFDPRRL